MSDFGVGSMAAPLRRVAMRRPGAILTADADEWHYDGPLDGDALVAQYDEFVSVVRAAGTEILWLPDDGDDGLADSIFTYDPSLVTPDGAVIMRSGKALRRPEAELHRRFLSDHMPILGSIEAPGLLEGGDCCWLDPSLLAVGRGFRSNQAGIDQLRVILEPAGVTVEAYDLPYQSGPEACLHLLSVVNPLDDDLALVYPPLLPVALHQRLTERGWDLLTAPPDEFEASGGISLNALALAPRHVVVVDGHPATADLLRRAGCRVETFAGDQLCLPCEGGPTCLTRPLLRR